MADQVQDNPPAGITDEMVEKAAAVEAFLDGFVWDEMTPPHRRAHYEGQARHVLSAALAGRTVVDLPEPEGPAPYGMSDHYWPGYGVEIRMGQVWDGSRHLRPEAAERYAAELLSAAREARRLTDETLVGDQNE